MAKSNTEIKYIDKNVHTFYNYKQVVRNAKG